MAHLRELRIVEVVEDGLSVFEVRAVWMNGSEVLGISERPVELVGEDMEDLQEITNLVTAALSKPILLG